MPTEVAVASALTRVSNPGKLVVHVLDCGVTEDEWDGFERNLLRRHGNRVNLLRHVMDMSRYDDFKSWHTSKGIYARLEIPHILANVDWCVYADSDTLFTADPLELMPLWNSEYAIMGHLDDYEKVNRQWHHEHHLPWHNEDHICAGFIAMNLDWFRKNDGTRKCFELLRRFPGIPNNDQDVLNIVCEGRIGLFPDAWGKFTKLANRSMESGCWHYASCQPWLVKLNGHSRVPISSVNMIWFNNARVLAEVSVCKVLGVSRIYYLYCVLKSLLFVHLYAFLEMLPIKKCKNRYDKFLKKGWPIWRVWPYMMII